MKKLRFNYPLSLSINPMLTPFLFVFFLLGFVNVSRGQQNDCPQPDQGCEEFQRTTVVDIATLWGGSGCEVEFTYTERLCLNNMIDVYGFETNPANWTWVNPDCLDQYNDYVASIMTQGQADIDDFILRQEVLVANAALNFSAQLFYIQNPNYVCPFSYIVGRAFFKTCAVSCLKWKTIQVSNNPPHWITVIDIEKIPCGTVCCYSTQNFCFDAVSSAVIPVGNATYATDNNETCDPNAQVDNCFGDYKMGQSSCMTVCDLMPSAKIANNGNTKGEFTSLNIDSRIGDKLIKAKIINNVSIKNLFISFMSDFDGTVSLFDIGGKVIFNSAVNTERNSILNFSTEQLSAGLYLLSIQDKNKNIVTEKIIIK